MAVITQSPLGSSPSSTLRIGGAFVAIFSLAVGALVVFAIPGACSFVGGLQVLIFGFLFILGVIGFLVGTALSRKSRRS